MRLSEKIHTIGAAATACVLAFAITMEATEDKSLETVYRGSNLIVKAETYITARELELFEISYQDANQEERLTFLHRDRKFAVYVIEKK